jgi:hypothetical protein
MFANEEKTWNSKGNGGAFLFTYNFKNYVVW